jgi:hypothetical protein
MPQYINYEVKPGSNVAQGLPRQRLVVLSPIWRAPVLTLEYPDGEVYTLVGWFGSSPGVPCDLQVFWTRHKPTAPVVALAIGGDSGVRHCGPCDGECASQGFPFMALAHSMIPTKVRLVIGPPPEQEPQQLRLLI